MRAVMPAEAWYVLSALLAPVGYVLQDCVADAMTVEAVPRVDAQGQPLSDEERRLGQTTMQTLGRVAIIGGAVLVSLANVVLFRGVESMTAAQKAEAYLQIYVMALLIPVISVSGVLLASVTAPPRSAPAGTQGFSRAQIRYDAARRRTTAAGELVDPGRRTGVRRVYPLARPDPGAFDQEIIFAGSLAIVRVPDVAAGAGAGAVGPPYAGRAPRC